MTEPSGHLSAMIRLSRESRADMGGETRSKALHGTAIGLMVLLLGGRVLVKGGDNIMVACIKQGPDAGVALRGAAKVGDDADILTVLVNGV